MTPDTWLGLCAAGQDIDTGCRYVQGSNLFRWAAMLTVTGLGAATGDSDDFLGANAVTVRRMRRAAGSVSPAGPTIAMSATAAASAGTCGLFDGLGNYIQGFEDLGGARLVASAPLVLTPGTSAAYAATTIYALANGVSGVAAPSFAAVSDFFLVCVTQGSNGAPFAQGLSDFTATWA